MWIPSHSAQATKPLRLHALDDADRAGRDRSSRARPRRGSETAVASCRGGRGAPHVVPAAWRPARRRAVAGPRTLTMSPSAKNSAMAGHGQIRLDDDPCRRGRSPPPRPQRGGPASGEAVTPAAHTAVRAGGARPPSAGCKLDRRRVDADDRRSEPRRHAEYRAALRLARKLSGNAGAHGRPPPPAARAPAGVDARYSRGACHARARRSALPSRRRSARRRRRRTSARPRVARRRLRLRRLERERMRSRRSSAPSSDFSRARAPPSRRGRSRSTRSAGDHERSYGERRFRRSAGPIDGRVPREIESGHLAGARARCCCRRRT